MNNSRERIEEQLLDSLLVETLGSVGPPDLTQKILAQLGQPEQPAEIGPLVAADPYRFKSSRRSSRFPKSWVAAAALVVAASVLGLLWLRLEPNDPTVQSIAVNDSTLDARLVDAAPQMDTNPPSTPSPPSPGSRRGIPLVMEGSSQSGVDALPGNESFAVPKPSTAPAVRLVSQQFDTELAGYWRAIGIEPTAEADPAVVVSRLSSILGVTVPTDSVRDPQDLQKQFSDPQSAREIAARWLDEITDHGTRRLKAPASEELIAELAACFEGKQSLDATIAGWLNGQSPASPAFYSAISHAGRDAMAQRLASLTMNVDLRCTRCHDATIEGSGRQDDYWGFVALLERGVRRDADGHLTIDPETKSSKPLFYELADGRQRLAEPGVALAWLDGSPSEPVDSVKSWVERLVGSQAMARGAVNSLWSLVHGQPLHGRVVDPITAPKHEALVRIEQQLVQDLIDSRFDVARTLSLIVASPVTRFEVPAPLLPENALVSSEQDKRKALEAVNAFAAVLPRRASLPSDERLDQAMRAMGGKLDQDGRPFVAQIQGSGADQPEPRPSERSDASSKPLAADFPVRAESLPVHWLNLIEDPQVQVDHLGYLAGMVSLPSNLQSAVARMQEDDQVSRELMLNRVWWLVRP